MASPRMPIGSAHQAPRASGLSPIGALACDFALVFAAAFALAFCVPLAQLLRAGLHLGGVRDGGGPWNFFGIQ